MLNVKFAMEKDIIKKPLQFNLSQKILAIFLI